MKLRRRSIRIHLLGIALTVLAGTSGCSRIYAPLTPTDPLALARYDEVSRTNETLKTFKGLGRIKLRLANTPPLNERAVWAGSLPAKLRVDIIGSGTPAIKLATDGQYLYIVDLADLLGRKQRYHKIRTTDPSLNRILSIPIQTSELVSLMAGRIPRVDHDTVYFGNGNKHDQDVLVLAKRWHGVVQRISLARGSGDPVEVVCYRRNGKIRFKARFERLQSAGAYRVPARLLLTGTDQNRLMLEVDRYFADAVATPDMFRLEKPN